MGHIFTSHKVDELNARDQHHHIPLFLFHGIEGPGLKKICGEHNISVNTN